MIEDLQQVRVRLVRRPTLIPTAAPDLPALPRAPRLDRIEGKTFAFWHDSTPEADVIYPVIERHLRERGAADFLVARQPGPAFPPLAGNLEKVKGADAAIIGVAW